MFTPTSPYMVFALNWQKNTAAASHTYPFAGDIKRNPNVWQPYAFPALFAIEATGYYAGRSNGVERCNSKPSGQGEASGIPLTSDLIENVKRLFGYIRKFRQERKASRSASARLCRFSNEERFARGRDA